MKITAGFSVIVIVLSNLFLGCSSSPSKQENNQPEEVNISVNLDQSVMSNNASLASWMGYAIIIADEMVKYYKKEPNGNYIVPFEVELLARESMIELYLDLKNNQKLENSYQYVEELILIKNAGYLEEYIFFAFNPGTWKNEKNWVETNFINWKETNIPDHKPVTLAEIKKK